jgi:hypothetical protein
MARDFKAKTDQQQAAPTSSSPAWAVFDPQPDDPAREVVPVAPKTRATRKRQTFGGEGPQQEIFQGSLFRLQRGRAKPEST